MTYLRNENEVSFSLIIPTCRYCGRIVDHPGSTCLPCMDATLYDSVFKESTDDTERS